MKIAIREDPIKINPALDRQGSLGSDSRDSSGSDTKSIRSTKAIKVFGDIVNEESSLCYSPSPMKRKNKKKQGLRNITNVCDLSPASDRVLPFGEIHFSTVQKNLRKLSKTKKDLETVKEVQKGIVEELDNNSKESARTSSSSSVSSIKSNISSKSSPSTSVSVKQVKVSEQSTSSVKSQPNNKVAHAKKKSAKSKFRVGDLSASRQVKAHNAKNAIMAATQSVNETLNASRIAKIEHHRNVAAEVARLREEWLLEREEEVRFQDEIERTRREMLDLRSQLTSQYAQNKADYERKKMEERYNTLDKEIKFKSDVYVHHKQKMKENEDKRRRMSSNLKARMWNERREVTSRIQLERIEEEHKRLEHKWAGERDAEEYLKQCAEERRESFAFRNAEGKRQRDEQAEREAQEKFEEHLRYEHKWAGEEDAKKYLKECEQKRRESFAFRNMEGRRQRSEEQERQALAQIEEHERYEHKWAGERDAEEYLKKCSEEKRKSFAFRNAEGRRQRLEEAEREAEEQVKQHLRYEHKWAGERDAEVYLKECEHERRESFAFRNTEGRRQRLEQAEREADEKLAEHNRLEHKWDGERDAEEYRKRCEKARRESLAFRGQEVVRHRAVMEELRNLEKEREHESYVLKWAAQEDVKEYLAQVAQERRESLQFRNQEGKRHRDLQEQWRYEELERQHELEVARSQSQKDVEEYKKKCAERDRQSLVYRGKEVEIRRMITEQQEAQEYEEDQERRALETLARTDVEEYVQDCKRRRRLSLAQRAKESRHHAEWKKQKAERERSARARHTRNMGIDRRAMELAREKERAKNALNALRHAKCTFSTGNPFGSLF